MNEKALASPCGIFCGACPRYYKYGICKGCRNDAIHDTCEIYDCCVRMGGMDFCSECDLFPCQRLQQFTSYQPGKKFAHYRHIAIDNLMHIKRLGFNDWWTNINNQFTMGNYGIQQRNPDGSFDTSPCACCIATNNKILDNNSQ